MVPINAPPEELASPSILYENERLSNWANTTFLDDSTMILKWLQICIMKVQLCGN
jgi:hypothetical protein